VVFVLLFCITLHSYILKNSKLYDQFFIGTLLASHLYYCLGAYVYWVLVQDGYFAGVHWSISDLSLAIATLSIGTTVVALITFIKTRYSPLDANRYAETKIETIEIPYSATILFLIGLSASLIVIFEGRAISITSFEQRSAYFLIAYQFSDVLIPVILFLVAARGLTKFNLALVMFFLIYASIVGFRYKIALIAIPLLALLISAPLPIKRKSFFIFLFGLSAVTLFTVLTLFRQKFSGIDLSSGADRTASEFMYGLFAEANIMFGLTAIFSEFIETDHFIFFQPFIDALLELIPRALYPDRVTGEYMSKYAAGFITEEGQTSGTAYPFIGEFAAMGGWTAIIVGVFAYAMIYTGLRYLLSKFATTRATLMCGLGLVAGVIGYYHYSRGYTPQILKAHIFVIAPYLFLCTRQKIAANKRR
jgi:hypothetical protein